MGTRGSADGIQSGEETATAYVAALATMDEEALVALFAQDAVVHLPGRPAAARGRSAIRELIRCVFAAAEPVEIADELTIGTGEGVALQWTGRWRTLDGEATFGGVDVFELDPGGRITAWCAYWDGSVPPSGP